MHSTIKKHGNLQLLEEYMVALKADSSDTKALQGIERVIKRHFDITFDVHVVKNTTNEFFGMSIYPSKSSIEMFVEHIFNKKTNISTLEEMWAKTTDWVLEIDSMLLNDMTLNANPSEMVAVLLHEIGHVVYSNTVINRVNKIMRIELMKLSYGAKRVVRWERARRIFDLVFVEACGSKNYHLKRELEADKFVKRVGYGDSLYNFIDKLLRSQGNGLIDRTEADMEKDVRAVVMWSVQNVIELEYRKKKLRTDLQAELIGNPSRFARDIILSIKNSFFNGPNDSKLDAIVKEQHLMESYRKAEFVTLEGFFDVFDRKTNKLKKLSQSDIDIIEIEIGRIMNQDDKIYTLDLIYDKLDVIETGLKMIADKQADRVPMSKDTLNKYKAQLEKLRRRTLDANIQTQYGLFVKYPKGYEG